MKTTPTEVHNHPSNPFNLPSFVSIQFQTPSLKYCFISYHHHQAQDDKVLRNKSAKHPLRYQIPHIAMTKKCPWVKYQAMHLLAPNFFASRDCLKLSLTGLGLGSSGIGENGYMTSSCNSFTQRNLSFSLSVLNSCSSPLLVAMVKG